MRRKRYLPSKFRDYTTDYVSDGASDKTPEPFHEETGSGKRVQSIRNNGNIKYKTGVKKTFPCDVGNCNKLLKTNESLRRHRLSHLGVKSFQCDVCDSKFSCKFSLQEHKSRHTGEKPLTCSICGQRFRQTAVLRRHMSVHSKEKPFSCRICGKTFALQVYVQSHMKIHTGEKPHKCDVCSKSFAHGSDLKRHKIIHTGVKPYACSMCNVKYSDLSSKRRHEAKHHKKSYSYSCNICKKQFIGSNLLHFHLQKDHQAYVLDSDQAGNKIVVSPITEDKANENQVEFTENTHKEVDYAQFEYTIEADSDILSKEQPSTTTRILSLLTSENKLTKIVEINDVNSRFPTDITHNSLPKSCETFEKDSSNKDVENTFSDLSFRKDKTEFNFTKSPSKEFLRHYIPESIETRELLENSNNDVKSQDYSVEVNHNVINSKFISSPELHSQDYYNWLYAFKETCKTQSLPLEPDLFKKMNAVEKTLCDFMIQPCAITLDSYNFQILFDICRDLSCLKFAHLSYLLKSSPP